MATLVFGKLARESVRVVDLNANAVSRVAVPTAILEMAGQIRLQIVLPPGTANKVYVAEGTSATTAPAGLVMPPADSAPVGPATRITTDSSRAGNPFIEPGGSGNWILAKTTTQIYLRSLTALTNLHVTFTRYA